MARRRPSQGGDDEHITDMLLEAQELYQQGNVEEAIELCEEAVALSNTSRPDAQYYLAYLYQEEHIWDAAIEYYSALINHQDYMISCYFALGNCYRAKGDLKQASSYYDEAVAQVNLDSLNRDEAEELIQICYDAARTHDDLGEVEAADNVYDSILVFFRSRGWQESVTRVERMMADRKNNARPSQKTPMPPPQQSSKIPSIQPNFQASSPNMSIPPGVQPGQSIPPNQQSFASKSAPPSMDAFLQDPSSAGARSVPFPRQSPPPQPQMPSQMPPQMPFVPSIPPQYGIPGTAIASNPTNWSQVGSHVPPLPEPNRAQVIQLMRDVESYISHGLYTAAIEVCLKVIELAPQYLDVHQALAEIYVHQGKIDQAITKFAILIDSFTENGRIDDAITTYRRILQLEPNNIVYRTRFISLLAQHGRNEELMRERVTAAEAFMRLGYPDRAIEQFEQAIIADPNNVNMRQNYALALIRAGRLNQGIGELQRILQLDPGNVVAMARWQIALCASVNAANAVNPAASDIRPGSSPARVAAVELLSRLVRTLTQNLSQYEDVLREYLAAVDSSPANGDLRYSVGIVLHAGKRSRDAIMHFQAAVNTTGLDALARVALAIALISLGDAQSSAQAVQELEDASALIRRSPVTPTLWSARPRLDGEEGAAPEIEISQLLARAYQRSGPIAMQKTPTQPNADAYSAQRQAGSVTEEIYRLMNEISSHHPNDMPGTLVEMVQNVRIFRSQRKYEHAIVLLNEIARLAPKDASVRAELAEIHISRGFLEEGINELHKVVDIYKNQGQIDEAAQYLQQIGELQWQMGDQDISMATLKRVLNLKPDDMDTRMLYVQYCLERGSRKEAAEQQTVLAQYYFHERRTKEAVAMLQQLIALDKDNYEAYDLLGQTYSSVGEFDQALRVYRHLSKINPSSPVARARINEIQDLRGQR